MFIITIILEKPFGKDEYTRKIESAELMFPNFDREQIGTIVLIGDGKTTTLKKSESKWLVQSMDNYVADPEAIDELMEKVSGFKKTEPISNNPEKQSEFQVDSSGVEAKFLDANDQLIAHLFVGKTTQTFLDSYIRQAESSQVFVAKGFLRSVFNRSEWRDKTVFYWNKGDLTSLILKSKTEEIELSKNSESEWQMLKPIEAVAKSSEVESLIETLSSLKATSIVDDDDEVDFEAEAVITATLNDGSKKVLMLGEETQGKRKIKRDDSEQIFFLSKSIVDKLLKKSGDLRSDEVKDSKNENEGNN